MNQSMSMVTRDTLRILDTKPYSHQKMNILSTNASFNKNGNFPQNTFNYFSNAQQVSALHRSFKSSKSSIKLRICLRATR